MKLIRMSILAATASLLVSAPLVSLSAPPAFKAIGLAAEGNPSKDIVYRKVRQPPPPPDCFDYPNIPCPCNNINPQPNGITPYCNQ